MKKLLAVLLTSMLALPVAHSVEADVEVFFSPDGGAREAILSSIDNAKKTIRVLAYLFTDPEIAKALVKAHDRGVDVQIVLDTKMLEDPKSKAKEVHKAGIPTYIDETHATAHNKVIIIDTDKVLTGSYNYTVKASARNADNLVVITSEKINQLYTNEWNKHPPHSLVFKESMMEE